MFGNTRVLPYVRDYEAAEKLFNATKRPKNKSRGEHIWADNERPLGSVRQHHYRVVATTDPATGKAAYKLYLYKTAMATYYPPDPVSGKRRVDYQWHNSITSKQFMRNVVGVSENTIKLTTTGTLVVVPVYAGCTTLVYDKDNRLIVAESDHTTVFRRISSDKDKEARAAFKKKYGMYATIAALRHEFAEPDTEGISKWTMGRVFGAFSTAKGWFAHVTYRLNCWMSNGSEPDDEDMENFFKVTRDLIVHVRGKALFHEHPAPTLKQLEGVVMRWMLECAGLDGQSGKEALPKFQEVQE